MKRKLKAALFKPKGNGYDQTNGGIQEGLALCLGPRSRD